jgi:hypothetical protein
MIIDYTGIAAVQWMPSMLVKDSITVIWLFLGDYENATIIFVKLLFFYALDHLYVKRLTMRYDWEDEEKENGEICAI